MKILAFDSAAAAASAALYEDGTLLAENYQRAGLTHSRTLLPMAEAMLSLCSMDFGAVEALAVTAGPGSFTGLRIGISLVKGLAAANRLPCAGVSTLEAIAACAPRMDACMCVVMDARAGQVYNAVFDLSGVYPARCTPDRAIRIEDLLKELEKEEKKLIITGDGAHLMPDIWPVMPEHLRYGRAYGVARAAQHMFASCEAAACAELFSAEKLVPSYHRLPQAERERAAKLAAQGKKRTEV